MDNLEVMERELKRQDEREARMVLKYTLDGEIFTTFDEAVEHAKSMSEDVDLINYYINTELDTVTIDEKEYSSGAILREIDFPRWRVWQQKFLLEQIKDILENSEVV